MFVSHAGADTDFATVVHGWLRAGGHEVFLDRDLGDGIVLGEEWEQRLFERLRWADAVVCILTSAYISSVWCTAELVFARSRGTRLLPLRAEPGVTHPLLQSVHHVDVAGDGERGRAALTEVLVRVDAAGGGGWPDDRSPFPGLRPFETDQHRVFFGRERETEELAALLRSPAEQADGAALLVLGPSGSGKSSLARAGLLPVMAREPDWWTLSPFLPGADPLSALVRELAAAARLLGSGDSPAALRERVRNGGLGEVVDDLLLSVPGHRRRRLLVVVDQFEEIVTRSTPDARARFAETVCPALSGPVQLVATMRPEFLEPLLTDEALAALPKRLHTIAPLRRDALRAVVEKPARLAGIEVDDALVDRLVADTDSGDALPLLAYTLAELAEGIPRGGRLLAGRYEQLGGVQGALVRQADAALETAVSSGGLPAEQVVTELLRLVTVDERGRRTRSRVPRDELPPAVAAAFDAFIARRLLVTDREADRVVVGVAHEAFLSAWPPLRDAIDGASVALRARRGVELAAEEWLVDGRPPRKLWERGQLAAAVADTGVHLEPEPGAGAVEGGGPRASVRLPWKPWPFRRRTLLSERVALSTAAGEFLTRSIVRDRWLRGRTTIGLSVLLVLAVVGAGIAVLQQRVARQQETVATARQLAATAVAGIGDRLDVAQLLAVEGYRRDPNPETRRALMSVVAASPRLVRYLQAGAAVSALGASRDGTVLVAGTEDGEVLLWETTGASEARRLGRAGRCGRLRLGQRRRIVDRRVRRRGRHGVGRRRGGASAASATCRGRRAAGRGGLARRPTARGQHGPRRRWSRRHARFDADRRRPGDAHLRRDDARRAGGRARLLRRGPDHRRRRGPRHLAPDPDVHAGDGRDVGGPPSRRPLLRSRRVT
ncbi:toll/interleukin-1 receptor domain-containing protein [Blastococcus sp. PRF04-17]|uniref:toll/interleukin-1 receptor domain-containing protein n=1 Tax=Blastococcus sp. PRF04-17 TaxID=2933797 RepID=UPI001FF17B94|nr:toll/interleukin-1 receptor domain-containing protein [Blastococcus sp. PRF04-17]UOY03819.1 TIR domain-containing protein [Blastococcus sp. PRF04-17]